MQFPRRGNILFGKKESGFLFFYAILQIRRDVNFEQLMHFDGFVTSQPISDRHILWWKYLIISCCLLSTIASAHCLFSSLKWKILLFAPQELKYISCHSFVRGYFQRLNISCNVFLRARPYFQEEEYIVLGAL